MNEHRPLRFAVVGHPNEGKSSVVSTLAENDQVPVSPTPGETRQCRTYPVTIDGTPVIEFVDTPGFQNPRHTLEWMMRYDGPEEDALRAFRRAHRNDPDYRHEVELLQPVEEGAMLIYVADGSRPLRRDDLAEMDILRRTGRPRMAILNCKEDDQRFIADWKAAFRRHFNSIRVFDAHRATYAERIALLESLKAVDQDSQPVVERVIAAFRQDWDRRGARSAELIAELLEKAMRHTCAAAYEREDEVAALRDELLRRYRTDLAGLERRAHQRIRALYKHNIFHLELPEASPAGEDLFSERVWRLLGLTRFQLAWAAGAAGASAGVVVDVLLPHITFGVFTAAGALVGALGVYFGGDRLVRMKSGGRRWTDWLRLPRLNRTELRLGPMHNLQFFFVVLDRARVYHAHCIHWAHARREPAPAGAAAKDEGVVRRWPEKRRAVAAKFFAAIRKRNAQGLEEARDRFIAMLREALAESPP